MERKKYVRKDAEKKDQGMATKKILVDPRHDRHTEQPTIAPPLPIRTETPVASEKQDLSIIESLDFFNGSNKLSICLTKNTVNRTYQVKVFLNGKNEIRPMTYVGSKSGIGYWDLLKEALT